MKRGLSILFAIVVLALSVGLIYIQASGSKLLSVQTGSMTPAIAKGSLVVVNRVPKNQLALGDVITYASPSNPKMTVTHRIAQLPSSQNGNNFITKGDANNIIDDPISSQAIIGKVGYSVPFLGNFINVIRQPVGLAILIYIPALFVLVGEVRRLAEYYRKQKAYLSIERLGKKSELVLPSYMVAGLKLISGTLLVGIVLAAVPAFASLSSNTATLSNNSFGVGGGGSNEEHNNTYTCTVTNNNNVTVTNNSSQTSTSGSATTQNNTTGGNASSGNASNSNTSNVNINITNGTGC